MRWWRADGAGLLVASCHPRVTLLACVPKFTPRRARPILFVPQVTSHPWIDAPSRLPPVALDYSCAAAAAAAATSTTLTVTGPTWGAALPPMWSLFIPPNASAGGVYGDAVPDRPDGAGAGGGTGAAAGGGTATGACSRCKRGGRGGVERF